jgi:hypothetical protein
MSEPPQYPQYPPYPEGQGQPPQGQPPQGQPPQYGFEVPPGAQQPYPWPSVAGPGGPVDPLISPDYAGWWERSINLVKRFWKQLLILQVVGIVVSLIVLIPAGILGASIASDLPQTGQVNDANVGDYVGRYSGWAAVTLVGVLLAILIWILISLASLRLLVTGVTTDRADVGAALSGSAPRILPMIGWGLLALLIIVLGFCACILPSFYFSAVFLVLPAIVLFERGGAIGRAFKLFHGNLGASLARVATIFGIGLVAGLIASMISAIVGAGFGTVGTAQSVGAGVTSTVIQVIFSAALGILTAPLTLATYADMRARVEPLSTAVLASELNQ